MTTFGPRGLLALTWLEIKIFLREPLGVFGSVFVPVFIFTILSRTFGQRLTQMPEGTRGMVGPDLAVFAALLISISAVLSLVTIIAIYRESGILKRLRATPLRPLTILSAHVLVKLLFTVATLALTLLFGRRYFAVDIPIPWVAFGAATALGSGPWTWRRVWRPRLWTSPRSWSTARRSRRPGAWRRSGSPDR